MLIWLRPCLLLIFKGKTKQVSDPEKMSHYPNKLFAQDFKLKKNKAVIFFLTNSQHYSKILICLFFSAFAFSFGCCRHLLFFCTYCEKCWITGRWFVCIKDYCIQIVFLWAKMSAACGWIIFLVFISAANGIRIYADLWKLFWYSLTYTHTHQHVSPSNEGDKCFINNYKLLIYSLHPHCKSRLLSKSS